MCEIFQRKIFSQESSPTITHLLLLFFCSGQHRTQSAQCNTISFNGNIHFFPLRDQMQISFSHFSSYRYTT